MSLKKLLATLLVFCIFPIVGQAQLLKLTVNITGIDPAEGNLEVSLFDSEEDFLKKPWSQKVGKIAEDGTSTVSFSALPAGKIAVVVVHDANGNNKLDNGFLGFGAESFAYTENPENARWYRFLFGRPAFEEAVFEISESTEITISLD